MNMTPRKNVLIRTMRSPKAVASACALLIMLFAGLASASTVLKLDLESLVANSDQIVDGEVVSVESKVENGKVYTYTEIKVQEGLKGAEEDSTVTIKHIGGRTEELATMVAGVPNFANGERVIVFLERPEVQAKPIVTGMSQGKFQVALGPDNQTPYVVPQLSKLELIEPAAELDEEAVERLGEAAEESEQQQGSYRSAKPADLYERVVPLDEFKRNLRKVIRDQQGE